jgi:hypothetical protein
MLFGPVVAAGVLDDFANARRFPGALINFD